MPFVLSTYRSLLHGDLESPHVDRPTDGMLLEVVDEPGGAARGGGRGGHGLVVGGAVRRMVLESRNHPAALLGGELGHDVVGLSNGEEAVAPEHDDGVVAGVGEAQGKARVADLGLRALPHEGRLVLAREQLLHAFVPRRHEHGREALRHRRQVDAVEDAPERVIRDGEADVVRLLLQAHATSSQLRLVVFDLHRVLVAVDVDRRGGVRRAHRQIDEKMAAEHECSDDSNGHDQRAEDVEEVLEEGHITFRCPPQRLFSPLCGNYVEQL